MGGEDGDKVFNLVVRALNRVLKLSQEKGLDAKYDVVELCTRAWLVWQAYQVEHRPDLVAKLQEVAMEIYGLLKEEPA